MGESGLGYERQLLQNRQPFTVSIKMVMEDIIPTSFCYVIVISFGGRKTKGGGGGIDVIGTITKIDLVRVRSSLPSE